MVGVSDCPVGLPERLVGLLASVCSVLALAAVGSFGWVVGCPRAWLSVGVLSVGVLSVGRLGCCCRS